MLTPKEIVDSLDKYIIGQNKAKHSVAVALRNRYRRSLLPEEIREEITPKNIIMIGPTGVGKTEIARRLAKLLEAPFVKVEATKYTEVGYVGRDVESMIRDLVEASIRICKNKRIEQVRDAAEINVENDIADILTNVHKKKKAVSSNPLELLLNAGKAEKEKEPSEEEKEILHTQKAQILEDLKNGKLEEQIIEIEVEEKNNGADSMLAAGIDLNLGEVFGGILPKKMKTRKVPVKDARRILFSQESEKMIDMDDVISQALENAEQNGIIFIDEIDKIAETGKVSGPDVSREGVQRDILPLVEGSTVQTKYGPVKTDFMLFIAAGAFHTAKITDLIPELQGRFPIKVKLDGLTREDFKCILTQPENAITKQYAALLSADNVNLTFTDDALDAIANYAYMLNETTENIGARRLHTVFETLLDDISFNATGNHPVIDVIIDGEYVNQHLNNEKFEEDIHKYIL